MNMQSINISSLSINNSVLDISDQHWNAMSCTPSYTSRVNSAHFNPSHHLIKYACVSEEISVY
jgi:hypothetical protein